MKSPCSAVRTLRLGDEIASFAGAHVSALRQGVLIV